MLFILIQAEHEDIGFKCDVCPLTLKSVHHLKIHKKKEHSKDTNFACKFCGKIFYNNLKEHEKTHQEPKFQCSICAKRLKSEGALIQHERLHRGEKPFDCSTCGGGFASLDSLRQHERGVHKISGPRGGKTGWSRKSKQSSSGEN